jgi:hypothetical protein
LLRENVIHSDYWRLMAGIERHAEDRERATRPIESERILIKIPGHDPAVAFIRSRRRNTSDPAKELCPCSVALVGLARAIIAICGG